jgi:hypothetical protein
MVSRERKEPEEAPLTVDERVLENVFLFRMILYSAVLTRFGRPWKT